MIKNLYTAFLRKYVFITIGAIIAIAIVLFSNNTHKDLYPLDVDITKQQPDNFLLALSWSPAYCLEQDPQGKQPQCRLDLPKRHRFIVHGLWPQLKLQQKYLNYCQKVDEKLEASIVEKYFYLMPSSSLMVHEWKKHASCGNFTQQSYFKTIEDLYKKFKIDTLFQDINNTESYLRQDLLQRIINHIPNISKENIVITCRKKNLAEIRICLNKNYTYRPCETLEFKAGKCNNNQKIHILF